MDLSLCLHCSLFPYSAFPLRIPSFTASSTAYSLPFHCKRLPVHYYHFLYYGCYSLPMHCLFAAIVTYPGRNDYVQGEGGEVRIYPIALGHHESIVARSHILHWNVYESRRRTRALVTDGGQIAVHLPVQFSAATLTCVTCSGPVRSLFACLIFPVARHPLPPPLPPPVRFVALVFTTLQYPIGEAGQATGGEQKEREHWSSKQCRIYAYAVNRQCIGSEWSIFPLPREKMNAYEPLWCVCVCVRAVCECV
jgi:hypothetical protein